MHLAKLIVITEVKNLPPDIRPFVEFKAAVEERELDDSELVAILNIDTTTCYIPIFLKSPPSLKEIEEELAKQDAKMAGDARLALTRHLSR